MIIINKACRWPNPDYYTRRTLLEYLNRIEVYPIEGIDSKQAACTTLECKSWKFVSWGSKFRIITKDKKYEVFLKLKYCGQL